ncbi:FAD binding domain-containing protein [Chloroflexota bacterium]
MRYFKYLEPRTLEDACEHLDIHGEAKILAGGLSLINLVKNDLITPKYLIDLKTVSGLTNIEHTIDGGAKIGALVTDQDVIESPIICSKYPILVEAGRRIASIAIRNHGTIGGNVCHADPSADFPPALIVLDARLKVVSSKGQKIIPIEEFFVDYLESSLEPSEILAEIEVPAPLPNTGWSFIELNKTYNSAAVVLVAAIISLDSSGICRAARLALGSSNLTPIRVISASDILTDQEVTPNLIKKVALEAQRVCNPISNVFGSADYKKEMVGILTTRALNEALEKAKAMV